LDFVSKNNINCEIFFDAKALDSYTEEEIGIINSTFKKNSLSKILHGPFMDLNIGSLDPGVREVVYNRYCTTLELCKKLGSKMVVFHSSFFPIYYDYYLKKWLKYAKENWDRLLDMARDYEITVLIENSIDSSPKAILALYNEVSNDNFKLCLDFGHYYIYGQKNGLEYIKEYPKDAIREVHLSDNDSNEDQHLALGKGSLPILSFFKVLDELGINPAITVEPHSQKGIIESLEYLKSNNLI